MPKVVMLIRHAEKPLGETPPHGVNEDGVVDRESLTPRGWQRAGALVGFFVGAGTVPGSSGLPVPTHLFASQIGPQSSSRRPLQTLQPLGQRLGLQVDVRFRKEEIDLLAQAILATDGDVLVAWEHHLIPSLALTLVGPQARLPQIWPDERFDIVWVLEHEARGSAIHFRQVSQSLLGGDSTAPIEAPAPAN